MNGNTSTQTGSGDWTADEIRGSETPSSELGIYNLVIKPTELDEFLSETNLGLGNYSSREYWQQVDEFQDHIYADAAFGETTLDYAIYATKYQLGQEYFDELDAEHPAEAVTDHDDISFDVPEGVYRDAIVALGEYKWKRLGRDEVSKQQWEQQLDIADRQELTAQMQLQALDDYASGAHQWTTPHGRMISVRHEASRSRGARLVDNVFNRIREIRSNTNLDDEELGGEV